jgi:hypothetical protein
VGRKTIERRYVCRRHVAASMQGLWGVDERRTKAAWTLVWRVKLAKRRPTGNTLPDGQVTLFSITSGTLSYCFTGVRDSDDPVTFGSKGQLTVALILYRSEARAALAGPMPSHGSNTWSILRSEAFNSFIMVDQTDIYSIQTKACQSPVCKTLKDSRQQRLPRPGHLHLRCCGGA